MEDAAGGRGRRKWVGVALGSLGIGLLVAALVLAFRSLDAVPAKVTPAGAVIDLRDYVKADDHEGAQTRLCGDLEEAEGSAVEVFRFFSDHDIELADSRDPGDITPRSEDERRIRGKATTTIMARPRGDTRPEPEAWIVHLERDPGGTGPMFERSLRWLVCSLERAAGSRSR